MVYHGHTFAQRIVNFTCRQNYDMISNVLKYTLELLLRYGIFNAGDILLIE